MVFCLGFFAFISLEARCENEVRLLALSQYIRSHAPHIQPPIGMNYKQFIELVDFMRRHADFADADVIAVYGSRTNITEGHLPLRESDLDILVMWRTISKNQNQLIDKSLVANSALTPWSKTLGFPVEIQIPGVMSFDTFLQDLSPIFEAIAQIRQLDQIYDRGQKDPLAYRKAIKTVLNDHGSLMNPGAIFIIRNREKAMRWQIALQQLGFNQIIHLY